LGQPGQTAEAAAADNGRRLVFCVIPQELADELHDVLRHHFRKDPTVEVVVERRRADRRATERRHHDVDPPRGEDRRRIRAAEGRRVGDRRAVSARVDAPPLPRRARHHAEQIAFVERIEPSTDQLEDRDTAHLVTRFQAGEPKVFATLYTRYFDRVYGYLLVMLRNSTEAEDAVQDVFTNAMENLPGYERRSQPFRAWLFIIARNLAVSRLRGRDRVQLMEPDDLERCRESSSHAQEPLPVLDWIADRDLMLFIERLPIAQRQVLLLSYTAGLADAEIATILDRTPENVRKQRSRALAFLRERLGAVGRHSSRGERIRMRRWPREAPVLRSRRWALHL
jgi:RNA polymerase sigma-70 factor (ECF subfamily)